jgi:hypothetical protein
VTWSKDEVKLRQPLNDIQDKMSLIRCEWYMLKVKVKNINSLQPESPIYRKEQKDRDGLL